MSPFEALYGRKCQTPLMWPKVGERSLFGPDMIKEAEEQVAKVQENLKVAQSRQKSYVDTRRRPLELQPKDFVCLKVSPIRGTRRFQVRGKLSPWYIGPYRIIERIGAVAYYLELPRDVRYTRCISHIIAKEMSKGTRRASAYGNHGLTDRFTVSGKAS